MGLINLWMAQRFQVRGRGVLLFEPGSLFFWGPTNDGVTSMEGQANKGMAELISLPSLPRSLPDEASYSLQRQKDFYTAAG